MVSWNMLWTKKYIVACKLKKRFLTVSFFGWKGSKVIDDVFLIIDYKRGIQKSVSVFLWLDQIEIELHI